MRLSLSCRYLNILRVEIKTLMLEAMAVFVKASEMGKRSRYT
jgi:hypothetical protein